MKTRFLFAGAVLMLVSACPLRAVWQPGLLGGTVGGNSINKTAFPAETNSYPNPHAGATTATPPWALFTTWIYWGQIYLPATNIWFAENIDDGIYMRIWDGATPTIILEDNNNHSTPTAGSFTAPVAGWYPVEIRMWNGVGGAGPYASSGWTATKGFGYKLGGAKSTDGNDYTFPDGTGDILFRYDDGGNDVLQITGTPANYGVVWPPYGVTNGLAAGDSFLCQAQAGKIAIADGSRASCAGYQLFTNETVLAASGTTNAFIYTHDLYARLVWQWETAYQMDFTAGAGGTLSTTGGWYNAGSTLEVSATPGAGYTFYMWTGDVPAGKEYSATLTLTNNQPRALLAHFATTLHVAPEGSDTNNGLSWATALATPQEALAREIRRICAPVSSDGPVLVAELGNRAYTADSLGPRVVDGLLVTRHIRLRDSELYQKLGRREISALAPGVLGQTGIETLELAGTGKLVFFMGIENAKFRAPVTPGCLLDLEVEFVQKRSRVYKFKGRASVDGKTTCECEFTAMVADPPGDDA